MLKIAIISVTLSGDKIAKDIMKVYPADLFSKNELQDFHINKITKELMESYEAIIFIASTGIAVRSIAPYLKGKTVDPAVIVVDCSGVFAISLVSGHLGGANELTEKIAKVIKAQPVITTATDRLGIVAPDIIAKKNHLVIEDFKKAKAISAKLIKGEKVAFIDEESMISLPSGYEVSMDKAQGIVCVTNKVFNERLRTDVEVLRLIRKNIVVGVGCRKAYDSTKMMNKVKEVLGDLNIDSRAVLHIATVEVKKEEVAILQLAKSFNCELKIFSIKDIKGVQNNYTGSDFVEQTIGVRAVCEPCVQLSGAKLLTGKISFEGMTICVGEVKK